MMSISDEENHSFKSALHFPRVHHITPSTSLLLECVCVVCVHVQIRQHPARVSSSLPPCRSPGSNSACLIWQQAAVPSEPFSGPPPLPFQVDFYFMISDDKVQVKNGLLSEKRPVELVTSPTQGSLPLLSNGVADRGEIKRGMSMGSQPDTLPYIWMAFSPAIFIFSSRSSQ